MAQEVISFHYQLTNKDGQTIDQSTQGHPLIFITESGQIIPGLESVLVKMVKAEKRTVTVPAKDAYGEYNAQLIYKVTRDKLPKADIKEGDMFEVGQGENFFPVSVVEIDGDNITLDGNHPLAGQDLTFAIEIIEKRAATVQEIEHGHVHGAGGCNH